MACLYMVATPIGNLADITYRAVEVLGQVGLIFCEDTRHSRTLLAHYGIDKPLSSAHAHNEAQRAHSVIRALESGVDVAYIADAGTPAVSDPGKALVRAVRDAGHRVVPIPGPSALTALLSANGYPGKAVTFEGFLSPKPGRRRNRLAELLSRPESFVLYESPHRLLKLLADLSDLDPVRRVLIGRELTKIHEELIEGTASALLEAMAARQSIRGEVVLLVGPGEKG